MKKEDLKAMSQEGAKPKPAGDVAAESAPVSKEDASQFSWFKFVAENQDGAIRESVGNAAAELVREAGDHVGRYSVVALIDPEGSVSGFDADRIYRALSSARAAKKKDVLLILLSSGGSVEPAFQISKLCRSFAPGKFIVAVPRQAKSAATMIAIGADEIHMGPLSHLGPIDPQVGGLPALGVAQALEVIATLAQKFPGSSDMLSRYLRMALTVEQIGYCERISESAMQYAERLLTTKPDLGGRSADIARQLVYEYKDHGFVIDLEEAKALLGDDWVLTDSPETCFAEKLYRLFEEVNIALHVFRNSRLYLVGDIEQDALVFRLQS